MKRVLVIGSSALLTAGVLAAPAASAVAAQANAGPTVTSVTTSYGASVGYTHVTIRGDHYTGTPTVTFGSTAALNVHVLSSHTLIALTPGHRHGVVQVRVRTAAGVSPRSAHDQYTYVHQVVPGTWTAATAPVPSAEAADDDVRASTSCPTVTTCYTVGMFAPAKYGRSNPPEDDENEGGLLVTTRASGETTTQQIALPSGVESAYTVINSLSCPAVGSCVAVGNANGDGAQRGLLVLLADGTWTASIADLDQGHGGAGIDGLSCGAAGECTAIGFNRTGSVLVRLHDGTWTTTDVVPPQAQSGEAGLTNIACATATYCLASGYDARGTKNAGAFVVQVLDGVQTVHSIPKSPRDGQATGTDAVQCPAPGQCTVLTEFGAYPHLSSDFVTVNNGGDFTIRPIPVPAGADPNSTAPDQGFKNTMSCPAVSVCFAAGEYILRHGHVAQAAPEVARLKDGKVHLYLLSPPTGKPNADTYVSALDCASTTACSAVGTANSMTPTTPSNGAYYTFADGVWTTQVSHPAPGQKIPPTQTVYDTIDCPAAGTCVANGNYAWDVKRDRDDDNEPLYTKASGLVSIETPN